MSTTTQTSETRNLTAQRGKPQKPMRIVCSWTGIDDCDLMNVQGPVELILETTNAAGEVAEWMTDAWWMQRILAWKDVCVAVKILPTPGVLSNAVIHHLMCMLRRVVPQWNITAGAFLNAASDGVEADWIALGPMNEIQFVNTACAANAADADAASTTLLNRITRLQSEQKLNRPIITVLDAPAEWMDAARAAINA